MEENSEAHMDSAVSSTSEAATETQEATSSHHNMETVVMVEEIKDEEATPKKLRKIEEKKADSPSEKCPIKPIEPSSPKEPPIKKIIIKASNKDYQIVKIVQKSPNKKDEIQKVAVKEFQANVPSDSSTSITSTHNLPSKPETIKSPAKIDEKTSTKSPEKEDKLKSPISSPSKESDPQKPTNETPGKVVEVKDPPTKVIIAKEMSSKVVSVSELALKTSSSKDQQPNTSSKQSPSVTPVKDPEHKTSPPFELTSTPEQVIKKDPVKTAIQVPEKSTPTNNSPAPDTNSKELNPKTTKTQTALEKDVTDNTESKKLEKNVTSSVPSIDVDRDASNDSQTNSDVSEKDHNRSISRELRSLINSAKESKIISECTQLTSKTRKSRGTPLDSSSTSLNTSVEAEKIQTRRKSRGTPLDSSNISLNASLDAEKVHKRRGSDNSQRSSSSEKSEKVLKRSMRSQNPEFANKVKQFLNSVTGKIQKGDGEPSDDEMEESKPKEKESTIEPVSSTPKKKKVEESVPEKSSKLRVDPYCWRCHWAVEPAANEKCHPPIQCTVCPRSFHYKCLSGNERLKINTEKNCVCPECLMILHAESSDTRSPAMKKISLGMLCELLKHALERMMEINGVEPFMQPVDKSVFPDYDKYVVHPMDLSKMKQQIADGQYGSTEAFIADAQWILHNSIIFNTLQSKLTAGARSLVRSCRAEMGEIEACPECYAAAHARRSTWFTDVCSTPHVLLWAKLKGFPYWPAKGMTVNSAGLVDVRFFGAHDRAWVPARDCFLYSEKDPNNFRTKRQDILDSMQEAEQHIRNISRKYGKFVYPPFKTQFDPSKLYEQLKMMIPMFEGEVRAPIKDKAPSQSPVKDKSRSASKSSKGSIQEFEISDVEDHSESQKIEESMDLDKEEKKESGDREIDKEKDKDKEKCEEKDEKKEGENVKDKEKEKPMEVDEPPSKQAKDNQEVKEKEVKELESSRKRRRSDLVEAVITICDTSSSREKRKRGNNDPKPEQPLKETTEVASTSKEPLQTPKEPEKQKRDLTPKRKVTESPANSNTDKKATPKGPVKLIAITRVVKPITPDKGTPDKGTPDKGTPDKGTPDIGTPEKGATKIVIRAKRRSDATNSSEKLESTPGDKVKVQKRRSSNKNNKSLNSSTAGKTDKDTEKKTEKPVDTSKEKPVESSTSKSGEPNKAASAVSTEKTVTNSKNTTASTTSSSPAKDRQNFDDDTCLAVIARETAKSNPSVSANTSGLPTITSVRSLNSETTITRTTNANAQKSVAVTVEVPSESSIFTPTSTDNVRNMKEAVEKLQKLRNESDATANPQVGRVGVRAFARMTSPSVEEARQNQKQQSDVQVEIKTEPIDLDDADRHMEKMDLMNAFKLRPVNGPTNLREVRINKVVVTSGGSNNNNTSSNKKVPPKVTEVRPRAKKTFPQPKKPDDGRSELNSKNSMVYIPIQPPMTQAPVRPQRPANANGPVSAPPPPRPLAPTTTNAPNNSVNTVTTPLVPVSISSLSSPTPTSTPISNSGTSPIQAMPTVGQVPTNVHTVPLITSVNGQWTFSLQPIMSVGGVDSAPASPMVNGVIPEHSTNASQLIPSVNAVGQVPAILPAATPAILPVGPPALVSTAPAPSANRSTDNSAPGELPRLMQRPNLMNPLDANTPVGSVPPPSTAGPLTAKLNQNAVKMADFFRTLLEDSIEKLDEPLAQVTALKLQLEQTIWRHQQQMDELKHNHELTLAEMRSSFEKEKVRLVSETRRSAQVELEAAVKLAKSKQWCANCSQEAQFYCCWNTSYCDYPCQRAHWTQHYAVCTQQRSQDSNSNDESSENRLQQPPENLPKTTAAPNLTVGGKLAPSRVYTQQDNTNKSTSSIIMSMVEDASGNQSLKCVGTYKPPASTQISPLIINKQLMSNEEAAKKVVTSGGYLIVGAANSNVGSSNSQAIVTQSRRTHTIQYYS